MKKNVRKREKENFGYKRNVQSRAMCTINSQIAVKQKQKRNRTCASSAGIVFFRIIVAGSILSL